MDLTVLVQPGTASGGDSYVDITGFAVMRITNIPSVKSDPSNSISAYAITPMIADPNDSRLRRGQVAKLVPWT